jgi:prepilin-type N-terminal cleavage/methylation domain-containing protein
MTSLMAFRGAGHVRPRHGRHSPQGGFTLLELMFSAAVLTVAASGMAGAMISAMRLNRVNNETTLAQQVRQHSKLTVLWDDRIHTSALDLPGLPSVTGEESSGFVVASWREVPAN